jgi:hypothetical protein
MRAEVEQVPTCPRCEGESRLVKVSTAYADQSGRLASAVHPPHAPAVISPQVATAVTLAITLVLWAAAPFVGGLHPELAGTLNALGMAILCVGTGVYLWFEKVRDETVPQYEAALQRWNDSYYCPEHDLILAPDAPAPYSPAEFAQRLRAT